MYALSISIPMSFVKLLKPSKFLCCLLLPRTVRYRIGSGFQSNWRIIHPNTFRKKSIKSIPIWKIYKLIEWFITRVLNASLTYSVAKNNSLSRLQIQFHHVCLFCYNINPLPLPAIQLKFARALYMIGNIS